MRAARRTYTYGAAGSRAPHRRVLRVASPSGSRGSERTSGPVGVAARVQRFAFSLRFISMQSLIA